MKPFTPVLATAIFLSPILISAQQTSTPPAEPSAAAPATGRSSSSNAKSKNKDKPLPAFLILGTVFNEKGLSFPGVEVRIRRSDEKRSRWQTETNSRGEFAVRVPPGYGYEVVVHTRKYQDQTKMVDSKVDVQQRLSIVLEPIAQANKGAKR